VTGLECVRRQVSEQRRFSEHRDRDRVGDHGGENARDQGFGFEVVAIQHLDRDQRGAERRAKHGADACGDASDHQHATLARGHSEIATNRRAEACADLHGGAFAAAGSARA